MATSKERLQSIIGSQADREDALVREFDRKVKKLFDDYTVRVASVLGTSDVERIEEAQEIIALADDLADLLVDAGVEDLVNDFLDKFSPLAIDAIEYFEEFEQISKSDPLGGIDATVLDAYITGSEERLRDITDRSLVQPIQDSFLEIMYGGLSRETLVDQILQRGTTLRPDQVVVLINQQFANFQRQVTVMKGDEVFGENPLFQYLGPLDDITSPQCREMLTINKHGAPGILYKDEITIDLHPNLARIGNPLLNGGHPRCRHKWVPISLNYAKSQGFNNGIQGGNS